MGRGNEKGFDEELRIEDGKSRMEHRPREAGAAEQRSETAVVFDGALGMRFMFCRPTAGLDPSCGDSYL